MKHLLGAAMKCDGHYDSFARLPQSEVRWDHVYELKLITVSKRDRAIASHDAVYLGRVEPVGCRAETGEADPTGVRMLACR